MPVMKSKFPVRLSNVSRVQPRAAITCRSRSGTVTAATNDKSAGANCSRRDAVQIANNEALQRRASARPLAGCYAELGRVQTDYELDRLQEIQADSNSLSEADLLHELLVVPEQPLVVHLAVLPVADRGHSDSEVFAGRLNRCAVGARHWPTESTCHYAGDARPIARAETDWVNFDFDVGTPNEECFQIFNMLLNSSRFVTVWPCHYHVGRVTLTQAIPLLIAEYVEIQCIEDLEFSLDLRLLTLMRRRRKFRIFELLLR